MTRCSEFPQKLPFYLEDGSVWTGHCAPMADVITRIPHLPDGVSSLHGGIAIQVALS
jgi:hypothetical protein